MVVNFGFLIGALLNSRHNEIFHYHKLSFVASFMEKERTSNGKVSDEV